REDVLGIAQRTASGQLGHLSQEALVGSQLTILLGVGHDGTDDLRAEHLLLPAGRQTREVDALVLCWERTTITARSDLLELDYGLSLVRIHHTELAVQEVDELPLRIDPVHGDDRLAVASVDADRGVAARIRPERPPHHLRPELVVVPPP